MTKELPANVIEYAIKKLHVVPVEDEISPELGGKDYTKYGLSIDMFYTLSKPVRRVIKDIFSYKKYSTFYNDFRNVVPNLSDAELFLNAVFHYSRLSEDPIFGELSDKDKKDIKGLEEEVKLTPMSSGDVAMAVIKNLYEQKVSPSLDDEKNLEDSLKWFITNLGYSLEEINPNSRNSTIIRNIVLSLGVPNMVKLKIIVIGVVPTLFPYFVKNASDLTKYLEYTGKIENRFSKNGKLKVFFNLTKEEINSIALSMDTFNENDLATNIELFKRFLVAFKKDINRGIYSSLKKKLYSNPRSFESVVNNSTNIGEIVRVVPSGIVLRNIIYLVKKGLIDSDNVNSVFAEIITEKTPTRLLIQMYNNLKTIVINNPSKRFVKRNNSKKLIDSVSLNKENKKLLAYIIYRLESLIVSRYDEIINDKVSDDVSENYELAIPTSGETQSNSFHTAYEGTKIPFNTDENLSLFIYWKGNYDIDLSATFLSEDGLNSGDLSYVNMVKSLSTGSTITHSGDITYAPKGAIEEIYIPKETVKDYRYALVTVVSYRGESLRDVENLGFGFGNRHAKKSDLNPKDLYSFSVDSTIATVLLVDLKNGTAKVIDMPGGNYDAYSTANNHEELLSKIEILDKKEYLTYNKLENLRSL